MISLEKLTAWGADVEEGIARCMGMEDFYMQLVGMMPEDENFKKLETAVSEGDTAGAFEAAHSLKGSLANLDLTPLAEPVIEITERLRNAEEMPDLSDVMPVYKKAFADFMALFE